jgi:hypothetical protein
MDETDFEITWTIDRTGDKNLLNILHFKGKNSQPIYITEEEFYVSYEEQNCCICMELREKEDICSFNCRHKFCINCIENCITSSSGLHTCALCREPVNKISTLNYLNKTIFDAYNLWIVW